VVAACSDSSDGTDGSAPPKGKAQPSSAPSTTTVPYPGKEWDRATADDVGLDQAKLDELADFLKGKDSRCMAVVKDGKLIDEQYWKDATPDSNFQVAVRIGDAPQGTTGQGTLADEIARLTMEADGATP
jgi:hypothetical protein